MIREAKSSSPPAKSRALTYSSSTFDPIKGLYARIRGWIDPDDKYVPRAPTIIWSTIWFIVFIFLGGFAIGFPTPWMRTVVLVFSPIIFALQVIPGLYDAIHHRHRLYQRNLANTLILFILTVMTMTMLYELVWYENLNLWVIRTRQKRMSSFRFPGVYLIQDNAKFQAHLLDEQPWTCFIGAQDPDAAMCSSLSKEEVLHTYSCNCNDSWVQNVLPEFLANDGKRSLLLLPQENLITRSNVMTVKFRFDYNASQADPRPGCPNLWMYVYDPKVSVEEAYGSGCSSMRLFNAYGSSTVLLNNHYFEARDGTARYEYDVVISTSPYMDLVCDVAGDTDAYTPCRGVLLLNVPDFDSTILTERKAQSWTDAVGQVGAYFALIQFVSWMISGVAWGN